MTSFAIGDVVSLKNAHPCGSRDWRVTRLGADIGLECLGCKRHVLLPHATFEKRLRPGPPRAAG